MKRILFVCTGNTCRSPMAEAFMREFINADPALSLEFNAASAGISACEGDTASEGAVSVMRSDWDTDLSGHRARILTEGEVKDAFLILTMSEGHRNYISAVYPEAAENTHTLKEYVEAGGSRDITDPFGGSLRRYSQCSQEIRKAVMLLAEKLKKSR